MKRKLQQTEDLDDDNTDTPRRTRRARKDSQSVQEEKVNGEENVELQTPTKPRRGRPPGSGKKKQNPPAGVPERSTQNTPTSKSKGKLLFVTPTKPQQAAENGDDDAETPQPITRNGDRSARRKSARNLIERTVTDQLSDADELGEEEDLAERIWDEELAGEDDHIESEQERGEDELAAESTGPATPSKRGRKRARRKKSPTPPQNLSAHEEYFFQNRPGRVKTSNNTLSSLSLLTHEEYHNQISKHKDPHSSSIRFLHSLHSRSFPQWNFELSESFNICLYGYGSKRKLVTSFAVHLSSHNPSNPPRILIVNGYTPTLTLRHILNLLASQIYSDPPPRLPTQPADAISTLLLHLSAHPPNPPLYLFINSLDAAPLRRAPNPSLLAQLAASPSIRLLATCDQPNFPLLWDTSLLEQYNWVYHDTTTFRPYGGVEIPAVVDDVNELLGRSGRTVKGKEGVGFVLRSLPENARNLYRVLVVEILAQMSEVEDAGLGGGGSDEEGDAGGGGGRKGSEAGVDYRVLYQRVVEEFICSNEMAFRQLLKEFHDHDMVVSRRDGVGTEVLGVPFRREEMEGILEDLMGS